MSKSQVFKKYESRLYYTWETKVKREMSEFSETILRMLNDINECVQKEEPVLSFTPELSGSCSEGTKVIAMDEADILCVFDHEMWKNITLSTVSSTESTQINPSFVQLCSASLSNKHSELFTGDTLSKTKLLSRFYSLVKKHFPRVLSKYSRLNVTDVKNAMTNVHSLACVDMVWHGTALTCQSFSFDIVPAIPVRQEQLPDITRQALQHSDIIQDLYVVPKTGTFDLSKYDPAFRLSFSSVECDMFHSMPAALKQGYMLTKVLKHDCLIIDNIEWGVCSYNLKTAAYECMKSEHEGWKDTIQRTRREKHTASETSESKADPFKVMSYACMILYHLKKALIAKKQTSFFLYMRYAILEI